MNADGTGRETITNHWGSPRWSRHRNRIASILNRSIALYDPATGREHLILSGRYSAKYGFSISPDGLRFCFGNLGGGLHLATLDEQTMATTVRPLVEDGSYHHSCFSPDGKRIVFSRPLAGVKNSLLHFVNVEGHAPPVLLPGQEPTKLNCDPTWSPDGKTIVFASEDAEP
jgi:Tol biopolymer transport system component